jgi:soluble lytic murein transglycosylase-like protein
MYKKLVLGVLLLIPSFSFAMDIPLYIAETAKEYGINPQLALYITYQESKWNPQAIGDHGTSYGIWQIHNPKQKGLSVEKAKDIYWSTQWAMKTLLEDGSCRQWSTCPTSDS